MTLKNNEIPLMSNEICGLIETSLRDLPSDRIDTIRSVIYKNIARGRLTKFTENKPERVKEYVLRVANLYNQLHEYVHLVQVERDEIIWESLYEHLLQWVTKIFIRKGFDPSIIINELSTAQASESGIAILNAYFPYDTDFEPWAFIVVQNTCLKYMRNCLNPPDIPLQKTEDLDEILEIIVGDTGQEEKIISRDSGTLLLNAVDKLSNNRKSVIRDFYLNGLSSEEIAEKLGKTKSAVYSLHFNALHDLRKILEGRGI
jgi:RNA polymerase sigma factor (sigma-70 family)